MYRNKKRGARRGRRTKVTRKYYVARGGIRL
jgi:hypothetical protein